MQPDGFIGRKIDDFTIQERIGVGGMASVYRAHQPSVNRSVALKIIRLDPTAESEFARRFEQEAKVIASLEHLHILPIYDYGIIPNEIAFFAMRLLKGGSLSNLIVDKPLNLERAGDIFTQIARGLAYAHKNNVIHRDLKPSNILLDEGGNAYLTDFGLAKIMQQESQHLTQTGTIVGTPVYMSPEQLRGDEIDQRSDLYSMGVILYHMLVGRPPFDSSESNMISVIYQHLEKQPQAPRELNPAISPEVELVVLRALEKHPDDRYNNIDEMMHALNDAMGRRISSGSYPMPSQSQLKRERGDNATITVTRKQAVNYRKIGMLGVIALAVLLGTLIFASQFTSIFSSPTPIPTPLVIEDTTGTPREIVPTEADIEIARARLGDGFIAHIACNLTSEYHAASAREMGDLAAQYGLPFRLYDSDNDRYSQVTLIERARADGAKGLIVCPLDIDLLATTLTSVQNANMPLVLIQSGIPNYGGVLMGGDDHLLGVEAGRAGATVIRNEWEGNARAIILDYPSMPVLVTRANGIEQGILEIAPNVEIVGRYLGATRENGYSSVQTLIESGIEFNAIFSINDAGSFGAIQALEEADIDPTSVLIASIDAEALAQQYIGNSHYMRTSVAVSRSVSSEANLNALIRLLSGGTISELILIPPGQAVTKETLAESAPE